MWSQVITPRVDNPDSECDPRARADRVQHPVKQRIGLFGGTFDPVHFGHLRPAVELAEMYQLDTLYLLPNHRPVHRGPARAGTEHRLAMLELAVSPTRRLAIDAREALSDRPSYTLETLTDLHKEHPSASLLFFMGLDAFAKYDTWHGQEEILDLANLVVVSRPDAQHSGFSTNLLARQQQRFGTSVMNVSCGAIEECHVSQLAISSTDIRQRLADKRTVRFLLPEAVSEYISHNKLYSPVASV